MKTITKSQINPLPSNPNIYSDMPWEEKLGTAPLPPKDFILSFEIKEPGFLSKLAFILENIPGIVGILFKLINIYFKFRKAFMAENPKDLATNWVAAITGLATTAFTLLAIFGIIVPPDTQSTILTVLTTLVGAAVTVVAYFTGKSSTTPKVK